MLRRSRKFLYLGLTLGLLLLLAEGLLRLVFPVPEVLSFNRVIYASTGLQSALFDRRFLSNQAFVWPSDPDDIEPVIHHLNLYGFRDRDWELDQAAEPSTERVLFVGDSFVEGFMAPADQAIPQAFERLARQAGRSLEAINLGIGGNALVDYLPLVRDALPLFRPRHVVLVLYGNDLPPRPFEARLLTGRVVQEWTDYRKPRLMQFIQNYRQQRAIPLRWEKQPFQYLPAVPHEANVWSRDEALLNRFVEPAIASAMKAGRFNPFMMNELTEAEGRLSAAFGAEFHLRELARSCARQQARLVVVYVPYRFQVSDHYIPFAIQFDENKAGRSLLGEEYQRHARELSAFCAAKQVPFLDTTPFLREQEAAGRRMYFDYDMHLRGEAYVDLARLILEQWP